MHRIISHPPLGGGKEGAPCARPGGTPPVLHLTSTGLSQNPSAALSRLQYGDVRAVQCSSERFRTAAPRSELAQNPSVAKHQADATAVWPIQTAQLLDRLSGSLDRNPHSMPKADPNSGPALCSLPFAPAEPPRGPAPGGHPRGNGDSQAAPSGPASAIPERLKKRP